MWKIAGTTMIGNSHLKNGVVCQDKISKSFFENTICICLADGAGSYKFSDIGALISCETASEYISQQFDSILNLEASTFQQKLIHRIRTRLGIKAAKIGCDKMEMSSTLLFIAIKGDDFIAGHLGDGVIGVINNGIIKVLSLPENGEYSNSTYFVTSPNYKSHFRLSKGKVSTKSTFFLMSDGASDALFNKKEQRFSNALITFTKWLDYHSIEEVNKALFDNMSNLFRKVTSDDCSIILAHKYNPKTY